ncbi:MAG TPA: sulfite exporter TauE/SafE family protein [Candidatus Poseidoniales archaeon]|nr:MAG TPA: sulfite exporter TauE/SafE family protein [Candidatus Poseidoniales archaeon]
MRGWVQVFFHCGMGMYDLGFGLILLGLMLMAVLYSSIGHGGASGYLVVLSLTSFGMMEPVWLKQNVWCLNLVVSSIAFYHYRNSGYHDWGLTIPFVISSVPMVLIGSYMRVDGALYDVLLSFVLLLAAWRLFSTVDHDVQDVYEAPGFRREVFGIGGGIGFASGVIGLGGGIFLSPLIILKKWGSPKVTAATVSVFVWLNSATGLIGSSVSEGFGVEFSDLAPFAVAVLVGGFLGSRYGAGFAPENRVRAFLIVVLVIASARRVLGIVGLWP